MGNEGPSSRFVDYIQGVFGAPGVDESSKNMAPIELRRFAGPASFAHRMEGIRLVHLTDLHFGRVTPHAVQVAAVDLVNRQKPDFVAITGDFVCHSQLYLDQLSEVLAQIEAPTFAVLGNHDHWSGSDEVAWALRRAGVELLTNEHTTITIRNQRVQVVGLDDAYTQHANPHRALRGLRPDLPAIGLSHIAEEADRLWEAGIPLVLSGHTHAGQVTLAGLHEFTLGRIAGHKYVHGLYGSRVDEPLHRPSPQALGAGMNGVHSNPGKPKGAVYVGAGIGASVLPFRIGERGKREVAIFELGTAPGEFDEHHDEQPAHPGRKPSEKLRYKRAAKVVQRKMKRESGKRG